MNLQNTYKEQTLPKLKDEFNVKNSFALPFIEKIMVNASVSEGITNKEAVEKMKEELATITGQAPRITRAKESISAFKLKENDPIGVMVTLRGKKSWDFMERFIGVVLPRIRDFRGVSEEKFDKYGNYSLGLKEQILFPEIEYSKIEKIRGLVITFVIKNSNPEKSKRLLEELGVPFRKH